MTDEWKDERGKEKLSFREERRREGGQDLRKNGNTSPKKRMQIGLSDDFPLHPSQRCDSLFQHSPLTRHSGKILFSKVNF